MLQAAIDAGAPVVPVVLRNFAAGDPTTSVAFVGDDRLLTSIRRVITIRDVHGCVTSHPALHPAAGVGRCALARTAAAVVAVPFLPVGSPISSGPQPVDGTRPSWRPDSPIVDIAACAAQRPYWTMIEPPVSLAASSRGRPRSGNRCSRCRHRPGRAWSVDIGPAVRQRLE